MLPIPLYASPPPCLIILSHGEVSVSIQCALLQALRHLSLRIIRSELPKCEMRSTKTWLMPGIIMIVLGKQNQSSDILFWSRSVLGRFWLGLTPRQGTEQNFARPDRWLNIFPWHLPAAVKELVQISSGHKICCVSKFYGKSYVIECFYWACQPISLTRSFIRKKELQINLCQRLIRSTVRCSNLFSHI